MDVFFNLKREREETEEELQAQQRQRREHLDFLRKQRLDLAQSQTLSATTNGEEHTATGKEQEEEDPLDAYMKGVNAQAQHDVQETEQVLQKMARQKAGLKSTSVSLSSQGSAKTEQGKDKDEEKEKMLKNKKAPARRKAEDDYLLTTKLFCGHCGALMFGESGTSRTGEVHRYYKCATAKKHKGCKKKTVRKQWLEDLVVNQTMQLVRDDAAMESIIAKVMELQNKENTNIPLYEKQLRDAESGIQNMLNAIQAGILTSSTKERLEQLEETKRELEARIAEEKLAKPKVTEEFIRFWLLRFRKLDMTQPEQRQALVDTFINAIYLYDDKVLITFNYKEGTQTVTFGEATEVASEGNGSDLDCIPAPQERQLLIAVFFCFI